MIECIIPTLHVRSIDDSVGFYAKTLGFQKDWDCVREGYAMTGISRDGFSLYLCSSGEGSVKAWIWIGWDALEFDAILASGVKVLMNPTNFSWAYEMRIEDPDCHVLRLGAEPRTDIPFEDKNIGSPGR